MPSTSISDMRVRQGRLAWGSHEFDGKAVVGAAVIAGVRRHEHPPPRTGTDRMPPSYPIFCEICCATN